MYILWWISARISPYIEFNYCLLSLLNHNFFYKTNFRRDFFYQTSRSYSSFTRGEQAAAILILLIYQKLVKMPHHHIEIRFSIKWEKTDLVLLKCAVSFQCTVFPVVFKTTLIEDPGMELGKTLPTKVPEKILFSLIFVLNCTLRVFSSCCSPIM